MKPFKAVQNLYPAVTATPGGKFLRASTGAGDHLISLLPCPSAFESCGSYDEEPCKRTHQKEKSQIRNDQIFFQNPNSKHLHHLESSSLIYQIN